MVECIDLSTIAMATMYISRHMRCVQCIHGYGYTVCMHKLSNFDQASLCCAHQSAIQVHPSVLA